jgi:predicted O-methyltransferase YrrM
MNEILLTKHSQKIVEEIVSKMEGRTFHHHFHILYDIISSINKDSLNYLEIGSYCGASSSLVLSHNKKIDAVLIDTFSEAPTDLVERNLAFFKNPESEYKLIVGNSQEQKTISYAKSLIKKVDLFYIDGDHSFNGCLNDFLNYCDLVCSGGYIVFDDYHDVEYSPQVKHAVDFIVSELLYSQFEVIGYFRNSLNAYPENMIFNNEFILRRR